MADKKKLELYTPEYYAYCGLGGILSCGLTHTAVTPVDLLKCRKQVGIKSSFGEIAAKDGIRGLTLGWAPTLIGYSLQGLFKFGLYEVFKHTFMEAAGAENAVAYKDLLWLSASASAEVIADVALCPWEAVKVRIQTSNPEKRTFPTTLREGMPRIVNAEGIGGLYKGLAPLWGRQVPYTMMKFWAFERTVEMFYKHVMPRPKAECSKVEQLGVTAASGYIAGVFCAVVSHPADSVISKLNQYETSPGIGSILSELGPAGIWRGLGLRIFMVGTLTCLQWFIYDSFKVSVGFPSAGGAAPAPKPANN
jgi:solute carrier family 25 phosphate transporter 3